MQVDIPFGNVTATITGTYYPGTPAKMYLANGDPGWPEEFDEFDMEEFVVGDCDIMEEVSRMYVMQNKKFIGYLDSIEDNILFLARDQYKNDKYDV